ncbi:MAG: hypothetical protein [Circular genetic element sp.]|nr:MAG: hypothetical protein [Circular genetic element sp.]
MQCIKSWTLIYSTEIFVELHCSHDRNSILSLTCFACTDPSAVDIFVLNFSSLLEFTRTGLLCKGFAIGCFWFSCTSSHQRHTPLSCPRRRSVRPRR